jgi:sensor histidine kinase YesM
MVGELRSEGNKLLTTKENPEWHGIGLQNVKRLVEEYSGYIQQEYEKGVYVTTIILPVQENN